MRPQSATAVTRLVNNKVVQAGGPRGQASAADRPKDISYLIDMATRMTQGSDSRFAGRIDLEKDRRRRRHVPMAAGRPKPWSIARRNV